MRFIDAINAATGPETLRHAEPTQLASFLVAAWNAISISLLQNQPSHQAWAQRITNPT